jgi:hypothetical protein
MLPLAPFSGSIGVAPPPLARRTSSRPPGWNGGNLDNKDLVAGSTLFLPVHVPGALLSIGDGHGRQGDGEATGTALQTSRHASRGRDQRRPHQAREIVVSLKHAGYRRRRRTLENYRSSIRNLTNIDK